MSEHPPALIEFRNVSIMRGERLALRGVSLRIESAEHVAILGPNGCGKSTFIKAITRECYPLVRPKASLRILGQDRWNIFELRALLGIITNDLVAACVRESSALEIVLSGFFSSVCLMPYHRVDPSMVEASMDALRTMEVDHLTGRSMTEMSSGEVHRVVTARALVHRPRALLLDEPCTSLDLRAQRDVRRTFRNLAQSGLGLILVTHDLADIIPEIGRVILLRNGRIEADGNKSEVLTAERLGALFGISVELLERDGHFHLL
jgi:iron complex transport system ATP-binding protein